jgi:diguanylate cyclase (GGDEF)-like protein/PAS domain S-box-containing protein
MADFRGHGTVPLDGSRPGGVPERPSAPAALTTVRRLVLAGMAAGVVVLAGVSAWSAVRASQAVGDTVATARVHDAYLRGALALDEEAWALTELLLGSGQPPRVAYERASSAFRSALRDVAERSDGPGPASAFVTVLEDRHQEHSRRVEALLAGDAAPSVADIAAVNTGIEAMATSLNLAARQQSGEQVAGLDAWAASARASAAVLPALFGLALALLLAIRVVLARHRDHNRRLGSLIEHTAELVVVFDTTHAISYVSPSVRHILGREPTDLVGNPGAGLLHPEDGARLSTVIAACLAAPGTVAGPVEFRLRHRDGTWRWVEAIVANHLDDPSVRGLIANAHDISERKAAEASLAHNATHDPVTALPNRLLFQDRVERALARLDREPGVFAVLFCDIDQFKVVNDTRGHTAGDDILRLVANRLLDAVRPGDTVARFGGDEFVLCCEGLRGADDALELARRLQTVFEPSFPVGTEEVFLTASIGVRVATTAGERAGDLVRDADAAMFEAKHSGRGATALHTPDIHARNEHRLEIETGLHLAIDRGELRVHYQPVVAIDSGTTVGVEALVRWQHPTRGLVPPIEFIEVAEATGQIVPIGAWVLREACTQLKAWQEAGHRDLLLSVNLSARQLASPLVAGMVGLVLAETGVDPGSVCLEVTETALMEDPDHAVSVLHDLRALGLHLAMDDFGTGYSSLSYLQRLPVDCIKIDRSFVIKVGDEAEATAIVAAVVHLAEALDLKVIAEGVETSQQRDRLSGLGCEFGQGYLWSRPAPAPDFMAWLTHGEKASVGASLVT